MMVEEVESGITNPAFEAEVNNRGHHLEMKDMKSDNNNKEAFTAGHNSNNQNGCNFCGLVKLPEWLNVFLTPPWLLVFLCWASTIQGMVINGFVNVVISTLEKRFDLQSAQTGLIAGSYDIGSMLAVIPISYFGGRLGASKPRYITYMNNI